MLSEWNSPPAPSDLPYPTTCPLQVLLTLHLSRLFPSSDKPFAACFTFRAQFQTRWLKTTFQDPIKQNVLFFGLYFPSMLLTLLFWAFHDISGYTLICFFCQIVIFLRAESGPSSSLYLLHCCVALIGPLVNIHLSDEWMTGGTNEVCRSQNHLCFKSNMGWLKARDMNDNLLI